MGPIAGYRLRLFIRFRFGTIVGVNVPRALCTMYRIMTMDGQNSGKL